jgi:hypothetical protein
MKYKTALDKNFITTHGKSWATLFTTLGLHSTPEDSNHNSLPGYFNSFFDFVAFF